MSISHTRLSCIVKQEDGEMDILLQLLLNRGSRVPSPKLSNPVHSTARTVQSTVRDRGANSGSGFLSFGLRTPAEQGLRAQQVGTSGISQRFMKLLESMR